MVTSHSALSEVVVARRAYASLLAHALTTDREEVMAVLLGDVEEAPRAGIGGPRARVWSIVPQPRAERREDRVEVDAPSLAAAAAAAEAAGCRVVGWFHSHPRITVQPSWQDVATQKLYEQMEPCFVALIASVFNAVPHPGARGGPAASSRADGVLATLPTCGGAHIDGASRMLVRLHSCGRFRAQRAR